MAALEDACESIHSIALHAGSDAHRSSCTISMSEIHRKCYELSPEKYFAQTTCKRCKSQSAGKDASSSDQEIPMEDIVIKEKASAFKACEKLGISVAKHFEGLNFLTKEQPKPDLQSTIPAPALVFTNVSTSSQRPSEINWTFQLKKRALENLVKQRCDESECHDPEEGIPVVVVTQPDKSDEQEGPEEDTRSVTASSVMSLFHRIQMDPMEKEWLRFAALGKALALHMLLQQDNTLVSRKDFVTTALHWAAKQGCVEMADMMARSGADVNQRAGYTPLHLASLHGHGNIIQLLINNYNAKVNIRDYHGKMAAHYWNGTMDIFNKHGSHSAGRWSGGRRGQCYAQLSALLSRSHGNINVEMCAHSPLTRMSQTPTP